MDIRHERVKHNSYHNNLSRKFIKAFNQLVYNFDELIEQKRTS